MRFSWVLTAEDAELRNYKLGVLCGKNSFSYFIYRRGCGARRMKKIINSAISVNSAVEIFIGFKNGGV
jgi:hypothetical protein